MRAGPPHRSRGLAGVSLLLGCTALAALAACGSDTSAAPSGKIQVVAAENFWGSIASQLGGRSVSVRSIVTDPNADPHEYESSTDDARAFADAAYVILNGAGYDDWARKLLDANPSGSRVVVNVADTVGKKAGDNPHFWYSPAFVTQVADRIGADYQRILPAQSLYFSQQRTAFGQALAPYRTLISDITSRFHGRHVGATEDIFVYLAQALKLDLISPPAFMQAVAEGNDPPAQAVAEFTDQLQSRGVAVLVYNVQTETAVTTSLKQKAQSEQIPVVGISETMQPPTATFESWQVAQLTALQSALAQSTAG